MVKTGDWVTAMVRDNCPSCGNYMIECNYKHELLGFEHACYVCDWSALNLSDAGCTKQQVAYENGNIKEAIDMKPTSMEIMRVGDCGDKSAWWQICCENSDYILIIETTDETTCRDVFKYLEMVAMRD